MTPLFFLCVQNSMQIHTTIFTQIVQSDIKVENANMQMTINMKRVTPAEILLQYCDKWIKTRTHAVYCKACELLLNHPFMFAFSSRREKKNDIISPRSGSTIRFLARLWTWPQSGDPAVPEEYLEHCSASTYAQSSPLVPPAAVHAPSCTAPRCAAARW